MRALFSSTMAVFALSLCAVGARAEAPKPAAAPGAAEAKPAGAPPEIDAEGLKKALAKLKGRPVLVNVFASWCTPCKKELPDIARLQKKHPKLVVIGIDVDEKEADAVAFLPQVPKGMTLYRRHDGLMPLLPGLNLPDDWNAAVPPNWTQNIPLSFVYNKKGAFETGAVGQLTPEGAAANGVDVGL